METIRPLAVVAVLEDIPSQGLARGRVGTVIETLKPSVFEVEFSDDQGHTCCTRALTSDQLLVLHYPSQAA